MLLKRSAILLVPFYFLFVMISFHNYDKKNTDEQFSGIYYFEKNDKITELMNKYHATFLDPSQLNFTTEKINRLLTSSVILDSLFISSRTEENGYYIKLQVGNASSRLFAEIFCSNEQFNHINNFHFDNALFVADITSIYRQQTPFQISGSDNNYLAVLGEDVLLKGTFRDAVEIASF